MTEKPTDGASKAATELWLAVDDAIKGKPLTVDDVAAIIDREAVAPAVRELNKVLDQTWAAMWDGHYGKGITAEYARAVDEKIHEVRSRYRHLLEAE